MKWRYKNIQTTFTLIIFLFFVLPIGNLPDTSQPDMGKNTDSNTNTSINKNSNKGHLRGFIYKSDNKTPLWGAQVVLQHVKSLEVFRSNVTDSTGDYELTDIPAGDYMVIILSQNKVYKLRRIDFLIKIVAEKITTLSFSLKKSLTGLFFILFRPCCLATIISGTAATISIGKELNPPEEEQEQSPTQR